VLESVDLLLLELKTLRAIGPHFKILHYYRQVGSDCLPGEEVAAVHFIFRGREFFVRLGGALLLLFDYLARHSRLPQTASQIALRIQGDAFCQKHGANAGDGVRLVRKINRSSVKVYIERLRVALGQAFHDARVPLDPYAVLVSEEMSSNQVGYQLKATFEWIHVEHPGRV